MYFLGFIADSIGHKMEEILRSLMLLISTLFYELIIFFYDIFVRLGTAEILTSSQVEKIYSRVTLILGMFMLFKMLFSFIQYLINPEQMSDKSKGASKLVLKAVIVVALLGTCPFIFQQAFKLQNAVLESNILGKLILADDNAGEDVSEFGAELSSYLFFSFYSLYEGETCEMAGDDLEDLKDEIIYNHTFTLAKDCVNEEPMNNKHDFVINYAGNGLLSLGVSIFVLYIILSYCLSVGMRVIQLAFLQLIAPIPIISYLGEDKDGAFSKWVKRCVSTFLDLFIRMGIIYFVVYIISLVMDSNSDSYNLLLSTTGDPTGRTKFWLIVVIILGLLMFAKKAPDLLKEVLPQGIGGQDYGFSLKKRFDNMAYLKGMKKAVGLVGGAALSHAARGIGSWGVARTNNSRDQDALRRNLIPDYKNKEQAIINDLDNGHISKREARSRMNQLRRDYRNVKSMREKGVDAKTAQQLMKSSHRTSMSNFGKGLGSSVVRSTVGAFSGGYKGYKSGVSAALKDSFSKNMEYARFGSSGASLIDLANEYVAGVTGYAGFGTSAYFDNLKYDIDRGRKVLKDNINGAKSARTLGEQTDKCLSSVLSNNNAAGTFANDIANTKYNQEQKMSQINSFKENPTSSASVDFMRQEGYVLTVDGKDYLLGGPERKRILDNEISHNLNLLESFHGRPLTPQEISDTRKNVSESFAKKNLTLLTSDIEYSNILSNISVKETEKTRNLESTLKQLAFNASVGKEHFNSLISSGVFGDEVSDFGLSTSGVNRAKDLTKQAVLSRKESLLSSDFLGITSDKGVASKLSFDDHIRHRDLYVSLGKSYDAATAAFTTITIKDSNKKEYSYKIIDSDTCEDSNGKRYNTSEFMQEVVNVSGGYNELLLDNLASDGVLATAYDGWLKNAINDFEKEDTQVSAMLTGMENSATINQAEAAGAYVHFVQRNQKTNRFGNGPGGFGAGNGPVGPPSGGPPPGGPRGGGPRGGGGHR